MVTTNSTGSVASSGNPTRGDQPQSAVWAEEEAASEPSPLTVENDVREMEAASEPSLATGAGNPESSPPVPKFSRRAWRSGESYHPAPANRDEDHWNKVYERADNFDKDFCQGWNSEIDALLTFAGLFSAVVTAFTVESYKWLQPDPQDMTNRILLNVSVQLAGGNATELPSRFTPSSSSLRINVLWFLSLTFSLTAGLVGILCKQWLRHYQQDVSKLPKEALAFRQFRYDAFLQCRVMDILSALPVLLGLGLILFFIGLIDFLRDLNVKVAIPITILIGAGFTFLVATTSAPAFQYFAALRLSRYRIWINLKSQPPLFAFKSPQSLAILHLITWLFPLSDDLKVPNWASLELEFFSHRPVLWTYTKRAFIWLDETYSHSVDMARQICICLQSIEHNLTVEDMDETKFEDFAQEWSSAAAIQSLFRSHSGVEQAEGHIRRDIIAMKYLFPLARPLSSDFDQRFIALEYLIRVLNSSHHRIPSLEVFGSMFLFLPIAARGHPAERLHELIWQKAILFRNLLSEGRWIEPTGIPREVQNVSKNLTLFTDEDLRSIFGALRAWISQRPLDVVLPSHCWVNLAPRLISRGLDEALRPPVCDFMAFLDSRFQLGNGVRYVSHNWNNRQEREVDSFFTALYAWIKRNPQDTQSFIHCRALMTSEDLEGMRCYQSFRDFEVFLEKQIARNEDENPVRDL